MVRLEPDGSLKTDESFSVVGLKDVYAIGDIATFPYHGPGGDGKHTRIEHWNVAQKAGRIVAGHIANPSSSRHSSHPSSGARLVPGSIRRQRAEWLGRSGAARKPDEQKWAAFYTKGETVVAVASCGWDPVVMRAELLRLGKFPSKSELQED